MLDNFWLSISWRWYALTKEDLFCHLSPVYFFGENRITVIICHGIVPAQTGAYVQLYSNKQSNRKMAFLSARGFHGMILIMDTCKAQLIFSFLHIL